jgi:hypothetical protein
MSGRKSELGTDKSESELARAIDAAAIEQISCPMRWCPGNLSWTG